MTDALLNRLQSFYEQSPSEKELTLKLVLEEANANPTAFIQVVHQQKFETVADNLANNLAIFYEAMATDLSNWADFFIQEAHRLFVLARMTPAPQKILTHLDAFCFIEADDFKNRSELIAILSKELTSENLAFRYYASSLLPDFIKPTDFGAIDKLRQLLHDPNWRVRYRVYQDLKDLKLLTEQDTLSLVDKVRARLWSPYNLD